MKILKHAIGVVLTVMTLGVDPLLAQDNAWGDLDGLLARSLTPGRSGDAGYWLPDNADPANATIALGVVYPYIEGSAGNVGIELGLFQPSAGGWVFYQRVVGIFGQEPRNAVFYPDRLEVSTSTLGPDDARCCPSALTRWSVERTTGAVTKVE